MGKSAMERFCIVFSQIEDPREDWKVHHALTDVLAIGLCSVLSGADSFTQMALFGREREAWFRQFLPLSNGIPSHDTFRRVFSIMDSLALEKALIAWAKQISPKNLERLCMDGKSLKGTERGFNSDQRCVHVLNVFAHESGITLGQLTADGTGFGEQTAMLDAIELIGVKGCLVSMDAAGAMQIVVQKIIEGKGDYLLPIKGNQRLVLRAIHEVFQAHPNDQDACIAQQKAHGRREERICLAVDVEKIQIHPEWPSIKTVIRLRRKRTTRDLRYFIRSTDTEGKARHQKNSHTHRTTEEVVYYASSRRLSSPEAAARIREHWAIENQLHWSLDVALGEDDWLLRERQAAVNLAIIRKVAFNILKLNSDDGSMKSKMRRAGWNVEFLNRLLFGQPTTPPN